MQNPQDNERKAIQMEERAKVRHCPTLLPSMLLLISVSITTCDVVVVRTFWL